MRLLFIGDKLEPGSGSAHKVVAMATEWERQGHSVWLATARTPVARRVSDVAPCMRVAPPARGLPERIAGEASVRLLYPHALADASAKLGIDMIYSRELPPAPGLGALTRRIPFVLEVNGDSTRELHQPWRRHARLRSRALQLENAAGVVFISRALARTLKPEPRSSIVLANPCLPAEASVEGASRPERPTLVLIGYAKHAWAGMDKIAVMAEKLPDLDFVVIGAEPKGPPNLRSFPPMMQADADRLMSGCTAGIGTLASHRQGVVEASPLKTRNYLSIGLPVIQACEDTDVSEADGCVLQLPNADDNVERSIDRIREFAWRAFRDPSLSQRALALARGRLSLAAKERERLAFMQACVSGRTHGG